MTSPKKSPKEKDKEKKGGKESPPPAKGKGKKEKGHKEGAQQPEDDKPEDGKPEDSGKESDSKQDGEKKKKSKKSKGKGGAALVDKFQALPVWAKAGAAVAGLGAFFVLYKLMFGGCRTKRKQSYVCSRKTVEAIRCYPVVVPVDEEEE